MSTPLCVHTRNKYRNKLQIELDLRIHQANIDPNVIDLLLHVIVLDVLKENLCIMNTF